MSALSGQIVRGYELHELIGAGGFGAVYRAYQPVVKRDVAVKIILPQYANQPDFIRSFETEAQLIARLEHLHIVPLYDFWREPSGAYLVMRWLRGGSLRTRLKYGPLDTEAVAQMLDQTAGALHVAHRRGVVHRDIKPDNILLDEEGNIYLTDFGIAQDLETSQAGDDNDTFTGSLTYTSPEQIRGDAASPLTDIYSLGILLYEALVAEHPFPDSSPTSLIHHHLNETLPTVRDRIPDLAPDVDYVIQRATAKNPAERYDDAVTMAAAFRRALKASKRRVLYAEGTTRPLQAVDTTPTAFDALLPDLDSPYKGLRPFEEADAADFFGREGLVEHLLSRMAEADQTPVARFLAVVGPSGSGKSSVVKAGLLPAIRLGGLTGSKNWYIVEMTPGARPLEELATRLLSIAINPPSELTSRVLRDERGILEAVRRVLPLSGESKLLLYIDQFEELFTMVQDEDARARFLRGLWVAVTDPDSPLRLIITLRADYYDRPLNYPGFGELIRKQTEVVLPMEADELHRAIVAPAQRIGVDLEPGLTAAIIADVSQQPGALPLLQYALTELFEQREGRVLRLDSYAHIGGVLGALARRADELYNGMDESRQNATRQLLLRLVMPEEGASAMRRRVPRSELISIGNDENALASVIDAFGKYRLLTFDHDPETRGPTVEVAHEALIREWQRLHGWLETSREDLRQQRRLTAAAEEWLRAARDPSYLARGIRLDQFEHWAETTELALNHDELAFMSASISERETRLAAEQARQGREALLERRSRSRLRTLVVVLMLAVIGALGLTTVAIGQNRAAQLNAITATYAQGAAFDAANRALTQAAIADSNALQARSLAQAASAQLALQDGNADTAVLLAIEANRQSELPQARLALADVAYSPGTMRRLVGSTAAVTDTAITPDGSEVVSVARDGAILLWDVSSGQVIQRFASHSDRLTSVAFSPDGQSILTGSWDNTASLWDAKTGALIRSFKSDDSILSVAFSPGGRSMLTGSNNGMIRLWNVATGEEVKRFIGHTAPVYGVAFSPDSQLIVSGSMDRTVRVWNVATTRQLLEFDGHTDRVLTVAFHPNGRFVASGSTDKTIRLWSIVTGQQVDEFSGHTDAVTRVAFDPTGQTLLSSSWDNSLIQWNLETGQAEHHFIGHSDAVNSVAISANGRTAVSASSDRTLRVWELAGASELQRYRFYIDSVAALAISPDGHTAIAGGDDNSIVQFDLTTGRQIRRLYGHKNSILALAVSHDGKMALSGSTAGTDLVWNMATGTPLSTPTGHLSSVDSVAFSADDRLLVTGSWDGRSILWDARTGAQVRVLAGTTRDKVYAVAFTRSGKQTLVGLSTGIIQLWDVTSGAEIREYPTGAPVMQIAVTPDNTAFMVASGDGTLRLIDLNSGSEIRRFTGHRSAVQTVAINAEGTAAVSGSRDRTLILWDMATGAPIYRFEGHTDAISTVAFLPDGSAAVSGSADKTMRMWRTLALNRLLAWTYANRYVPPLDCNNQPEYRLEGLCGDFQASAPDSATS